MPERRAPRKRWPGNLIRLLVSVVVIGLVCYMLQFDDTVTLVSGKTLCGKIVAQTDASLDFRDNAGKLYTLSTAEIKKQDDHGNLAIKLGILTIFRRLDRTYAMLGFLMLLPCYFIAALRWMVLLRSQDIPVSYIQAIRWTFVGMFFNNMLPGSTGGDLVKAYYVARECQARTRAVVSVFVDRIIGLLALLILTGVVCLFHLDRPEFRKISISIFGILGALAAGGTVYFSQTIRRLICFDAILAKLPLQNIVQAVDEAVTIYREKKGAVAIAVALGITSQVILVGSHHMFGRSLGIDQSLGTYYILVPVTLIATAVPIAARGWGVGEAAFAYLFSMVGVAQERAVALSVTYRLATVLISLLGGLFVLAAGRVPSEKIDLTLSVSNHD